MLNALENQVNFTAENTELKQLFPFSSVKVIKLIGYSFVNKETDMNKRYQIAKRPYMKNWQDANHPGLNSKEIQSWCDGGGWVGLLIPRDHDVLDIDDEKEGELVYQALLKENYVFHAIKTPNGYQFFFRSSGLVKTQDAKVLMAAGVVGDYRLAGKGQIVLPAINTEGRYWIRQATDLTEGEPLTKMPVSFNRLKRVEKTGRPFPIPLVEGSRNNILYKHCCRLVEFGFKEDEVIEIAGFLNRHFFFPALQQREWEETVHSALKRSQSGKTYLFSAQATQTTFKTSQDNNIPLPPEPPEPPKYRGNEKKEDPKFNCTEIGNAERLVHYHSDKLKYCIEYEEWLIWNGKVWEKDRKKQIERIATQQLIGQK